MITILEQFRNLQFGNKLHFRFKKKTYYFLFISISILEILKRSIDDDNYNPNQHTYRMVRYTSQNYHE